MTVELDYSPKAEMFFIRCEYEEKHIPDNAGFHWNKYVRTWCTPNAFVAEGLGQYATVEAKEAIEKSKEIYAKSFAVDTDFQPPVPEGKKYLDYQRAGIEWAVNNKRSLIADEMGLGKTIQAIGAMNVCLPKQTLICCPASLKLNWKNEIFEWFVPLDKTSIRVVRKGTGVTRDYGIHWTESDHNIIIINYDLIWLPRIVEMYKRSKFDLVILDEVHYLKNTTSKRSKALVGPHSVARKAGKVISLTGTPLLNRPVEIFALMSAMSRNNMQPFTDYYRFTKHYCGGYHDRFGWNVRGASNLEDLGQRLRNGFMIRRKKKDVLKDLPPRNYHMIPLELSSVDEKIIKKQAKVLNIKDLKKQDIGDELGELAEERHEIANLKLSLCISHLKNLLETVEKVVVFAHHRDIISKVFEPLKKYNPVKIDGSMSVDKRQEAVESFQNDKSTRVFIGQLQAAGVGHTLTAASTVVFIEFSWTPGEILQAIDRCHRIGQDEPVDVQFLCVTNSIEEHMVYRVLQKVKKINEVVK